MMARARNSCSLPSPGVAREVDDDDMMPPAHVGISAASAELNGWCSVCNGFRRQPHGVSASHFENKIDDANATPHASKVARFAHRSHEIQYSNITEKPALILQRPAAPQVHIENRCHHCVQSRRHQHRNSRQPIRRASAQRTRCRPKADERNMPMARHQFNDRHA